MYNGQGSSGGGSFAPNFGGFMNDQTAQMGFQIGKSAVMAGQEYVDQNVSAPRWSNAIESREEDADSPAFIHRSTATSPSQP